jgi:hypothetical protein
VNTRPSPKHSETGQLPSEVLTAKMVQLCNLPPYLFDSNNFE